MRRTNFIGINLLEAQWFFLWENNFDGNFLATCCFLTKDCYEINYCEEIILTLILLRGIVFSQMNVLQNCFARKYVWRYNFSDEITLSVMMLNGGNYAIFLRRNLGSDKRKSHLRQINSLLKVEFGDEILFSS